MTTTLMFTVPGALAPKGSTRAFTFRRNDGSVGAAVTHDNTKTKTDQARIAWTAAEVMRREHVEPFTGAVAVRLEVVLKRPKKKVRAWPTVKPDLDKLARTVLDALTGVVYADDAAVCRLDASKRYVAADVEPYVRIEVQEER